MQSKEEEIRIKGENMKKDNHICYLIGSMEALNDGGLNWRLQYRDALEPYGVECIIPNFEEAELIPDVKAFMELKRTNYQEFKKIMRKIIDKDVGFVHQADFLLCRYEGESISGTTGEAHEAWLHSNTPAFLITSLPFHKVPSWFGACFEEEFHTLEEFLKFFENRSHYYTGKSFQK